MQFLLDAKSANLFTTFLEHQMKDSLQGQHLVQGCGIAHNFEWEILNACRGVEKLTIKEAIIIKAKTVIKYARRVPGRELTLKFEFQGKQFVFSN